MNRLHLRALALAGLAFATIPALGADLTVQLDARRVAERRVHTDLTLQVEPGPLTLVYPKWIPGEHEPSGPIETMIGLKIRAGNQTLPWQRNPIDNFSITLTVPQGASELEISLDSGLPIDKAGFSAGPTATEALAVISWNQFVMLPKGSDADAITAHATLLVPSGWHVASALETTPAGAIDGADRYRLETASLARLIDSPVQMGRHTRSVSLDGSPPDPTLKHQIAIAADSAAALEVPADFARLYGQLVAEAGRLFGTRMYRHYTWLLTLSDHVAWFGLEHHESSDDRAIERELLEPETRMLLSELLAHEYVHSWNGKYRRPKGLLSPDYFSPMDDSLLWVYEGMTQFWGNVLPARAGLIDEKQYREMLAEVAGDFDTEPGVNWRTMADTARGAQRLYDAPTAWQSSRRDTDFYDASNFLWLDVDAELRERTHGRASLDDYVRRFYAGTSGAPALKPYVEEDVYQTLASIAPGDWHGLVHRHLDELGTGAITNALARVGWKLGYSAEKNVFVAAREKKNKTTNRRWSIGLLLDEKNVVEDVIANRAAAEAGVSPGDTVLAVNGRKYTTERLDDAIAEAQHSKAPITLLIDNGEFYRTVVLHYTDGPRYPHLERISDRPDGLAPILRARRGS
ncbi:MAG TPA: PDZ domain-containing protein [Steroidobacteraceae bacterium]|nr:PDZ domain-containing protein [Steroidobacteraceae bacterium]